MPPAIDELDFDLRYDDRVLGFHVFVNTDRDPGDIAKRVQRAGRSEKREALTCWAEGYRDGHAVWAAMLRERGVTNDSVLQYGGRILAVHLFVNTDRDAYHIHKAILRIARGPRLDACVCWSEMYEGENGRKIWEGVKKVAGKALTSPNAKPYDLGPP